MFVMSVVFLYLGLVQIPLLIGVMTGNLDMSSGFTKSTVAVDPNSVWAYINGNKGVVVMTIVRIILAILIEIYCQSTGTSFLDAAYG